MIVYIALYCPDNQGSSARIFSIHLTQNGAKEAIKNHKLKIKNEFNIEKEEMNKKGFSDAGIKWNYDKWWRINRMEVLP